LPILILKEEMRNKYKELLLNRGLLLGLFFSVFPILDLMYGTEMSLTKYYSIFSGFWFVMYSVAIVYIGKEFRTFDPIFDFRSSFRVLFIVSSLALSILTVTRISLWNVFYPTKYIELNEARDVKLISFTTAVWTTGIVMSADKTSMPITRIISILSPNFAIFEKTFFNISKLVKLLSNLIPYTFSA
jgi:hypothetical protein